ncbi:MAG: phosphatase PAP2 family protein [Salinivirgaceae bacterium]
MLTVFRNQRYFFGLLTLWVIAATVLLFIQDKIYWQQLANGCHFGAGDYFFKYITLFGDGVMIAVLSVLLGFYRIRFAILSMSSFLLSGLFAQVLKRLVFDHVHRPAYVFQKLGLEIDQVLDVAMRSNHSFPSGHTTTAFAFFMVLSIYLAHRKPALQLVFFGLALFTGLSRIYLNLHFLNDVVFGSILGVLTTFFLYLWINKMPYNWLDRGFLNLKMRNK